MTFLELFALNRELNTGMTLLLEPQNLKGLNIRPGSRTREMSAGFIFNSCFYCSEKNVFFVCIPDLLKCGLSIFSVI